MNKLLNRYLALTALAAVLALGAAACGGESVSAGPADETDTGGGEGEGEADVGPSEDVGPQCPAGREACPLADITQACTCADGQAGERGCEAVGALLCWTTCECSSLCEAGAEEACTCGAQQGMRTCGADGAAWGECNCSPCPGTDCPDGQMPDPEFECGCQDTFRENVPCDVDNATEAFGIRVFREGEWRWATCLPRACSPGFELRGTECLPEQAGNECPEGQVLNQGRCEDVCPPDEVICQCARDICFDFDCGPGFCDPANNCEQVNPAEFAQCPPEAPPIEQCETCHNSAHANNQPGIEMPHVPFLDCTYCHLGDAEAGQAADAHVPMPAVMERTWRLFDVNNPTGDYFNYLTHIGVEREDFDDPATAAEDFERGPNHEGLRWLMFVNPSDIRVVDYACGGGGCHAEINSAVKQSLMRTSAGVLGGARYAVGLARLGRNMPNTDQGARLSTVAASTTGITDGEFNPNDTPGTVENLSPYPTQNRQHGGVNEVNLLEDAIDKACGDCHIGAKGHNQRYGDFRSGGCAACHVLYADDGRSRSDDPLIEHGEPSYDQQRAGTNDAYVDIKFNPGERPHPFQHRLTRKMPATQCGHCHRESNWTVFQFKGLRIDPNQDLARTYGCQEDGNAAICRYDAQIYDPTKGKRRHGLSYHQIIDFEDLNGDGVDDTPADVHWLAGLECIDCHLADEMHGDGSMKSRMDQAIKIRCESCHGTIDSYVNPDTTIVGNIEELGGQFYLKSKITGNMHYIYQVRDSVWPADQGPIDPRRGNPVYTPNADYAHGRWNGVATNQDGIGIQYLDPSDPEAGETRPNFGHSDTLECHACHSTWGNQCYGCHLTLADYDPADGMALNYYSSISGVLTPGRVVQKDVTYMSTLDLQIGINSHGKVSQFTPAGKMFFRYLTAARGDDHFALETGASYKTYRDRLGWGNRVYDQDEPVGLAPQEGLTMNNNRRANENAALAYNPVVPHTTQHKPRNCTNCHVPVGHDYDPAGDAYALQAAAAWGVHPDGTDARVSAYLDAIPESMQRYSGAVYETSAGFLIPDAAERDHGDVAADIHTAGGAAMFAGATPGDNYAHRLDWVVLEDGFPLSSSSHNRIDGGNGLPRDPDRWGAGPLNNTILTKLRDRVRVWDMDGYNRVNNKLEPVLEGVGE